MWRTIFLCFFVISCVYKPWVSKLHPAGAFSRMKIASLEISSMGIIEIPTFSLTVIHHLRVLVEVKKGFISELDRGELPPMGVHAGI